MTQEELILILGQHPKLGAQSIKKCLNAYHYDPKLRNLHRECGEKIALYANEALIKYNPDQIRDCLCRNNIGYLTCLDKRYPEMLRQISDYPVLLYIKGSFDSLLSRSISIVGSRKFTSYGARTANFFSKSLAASGLTVVSGLALGIDTFAHRGALEAQGKTIAVLGCGLDCVYPASNQSLAREIIETGGALVSEYPPGSEPFKSNFPARNRIIAGLSSHLLVVEAALDSGALITAKAALEYNREICAIPGEIWNDASSGTNYLIQEGARLVSDPKDIIDDYDLPQAKCFEEAQRYLPQDGNEKIIIDLIGDGALLADEIIRQSGGNVAEISHSLTMLEMKGILENVNGFWSCSAIAKTTNKNLKKKGKG